MNAFKRMINTLIFVGRLLLWIRLLWFFGLKHCKFSPHRFPSQPPFSYAQKHSSLLFGFLFFSCINSMVKHYKAFDSYYCCVTVTLLLTETEKPRQPAAFKILSFFRSLILVLRQEHGSGVEGSQPVRGNLCCMGKTPQGSLHIRSIVAQGQDRAK